MCIPNVPLDLRKFFLLFLDKWHGMTMKDIRELEDKTKDELETARKTGEVKGTKPV